MGRHTTFRFCLDPTAGQAVGLWRHAGAARFAFNQCLRLHLDARRAWRRDPAARVPWSGFDLINAFNAWKKTDAAGRVIAVDAAGRAEVASVGLGWRDQVSQQVFEEAAVDLGRALRAWTDSRHGRRTGRRVRHPRWKKKTRSTPTFRLRSKQSGTGGGSIRIAETHPRSVTLPRIGAVRVREDTRRLRRLIRTGRGRVLSATVSWRAGRWWVAVTVLAADLHPDHQHVDGGADGWVGVDRGLSAWLVAATSTGRQVTRVDTWPRALTSGLARQRRLSRALCRAQRGSNNRAEKAARLGRHHAHVANVRRHFIHQVSRRLVQTHDRLVIEDLNITGMLANRHLARTISDAAWAELARQLDYKQAWRGGQIRKADRWYPSSQICSGCGRRRGLPLSERTYHCNGCGLVIDRDLNAAANLAAWAEHHAGRVEHDHDQVDGNDPSTTMPGRTDPGPGTRKQQARSPTPTDSTALATIPWWRNGLDDVGTHTTAPLRGDVVEGRPRRAVSQSPSGL